MSECVIAVEGLSKRYVIRHQVPRAKGSDHGGMAEVLRAWRRGQFRTRTTREEFWALRDVGFTVARGEVVGIIGRNGAGKSTLLKVLSRITEPTEGRIRIRGRVASLLEVGTGFHPELTGRENIFLNGAILGMTKSEVKARFDEIVAFSEVERFLDTPVKRYSSGMYVRLAFAVAAHLEPEVLIIDEVLAVGDADFQRKCLGKMNSAAREGRTVLFVSHNMGAVAELCGRCIILRGGQIAADGLPQQVIGEHLAQSAQGGEVDLRDWKGGRSGTGPMRVTRVSTCDTIGRPRAVFKHGDTTRVRFEIEGPAGTGVLASVSICNNLSHLVLHYATNEDRVDLRLENGSGVVDLTIPENALNDGQYYVSVWLGDERGRLHDKVENALSFEVNSAADGRIRAKGMVRLPGLWSISRDEASLAPISNGARNGAGAEVRQHVNVQ